MTNSNPTQSSDLSVVAVIPARYASTRFPGKPLAKILGKSLIQRTYENAKQCPLLTDVIVATDDPRIFDHVLSFQGKAVMTSDQCETGSDRLVEAIQSETIPHADIILNVQGDEPCVLPETLSAVLNALIQDSQTPMATAAVRIETEEEARNPSIVKCVMDCQGNALYFSRAMIPSNKTGMYLENSPLYRHLGIYAYRRSFLLHYARLSKTPLQSAEDLEQLKVLEHGYRIKVALVKETGFGVDHPEDIKKVEQWLLKQNTFS